jgi:hypothetical protein
MYNEYLDEYKRTTEYVRKRGGRLSDSKPSNIYGFQSDFNTALEEYKYKKRGAASLARRLAKEELYINSWERATKLAEAHVRKYGGKVTLHLIQSYRMETVKGPNIVDDIRDEIKSLKKRGVESTSLLISQEYFGSI